MHYRYGAQDQFDRTKDSLKNPAAGVSSKPRALLDAMNYAGSFPGFSTKVRFRSKQGENLKIGTSPLYARATDSLIHYVEARKPLATGALHIPDPDANPTGSHALPPSMTASLPGLAFMDDQAAVKQRQPRLSTPALSSLLGIIVAVVVGLAIASGDSFKIRTVVDTAGPASASAVGPSTALVAPPSANSPERLAAPAKPDTLARPVVPSEPARVPMAAAPVPQIPPVEPATAANAAAPATPVLATKPAPRQKPPAALATDQSDSTPVSQLQPKNRVLSKQRAKPATSTAQAHIQAPQQSSSHTAKKVRRNARSAESPSRQAPARRPYSDQEPAYTAEARPTTRTQYARCSQESGLFRRERCKWRVCDGKWGHDGCPAYKHKATPFIGAMALNNDQRQLPLAQQSPLSTTYHSGAPTLFSPDADNV